MLPGWTKISAAAKYAGVSPRTLEDWLRDGLKYVQLPSGLRLTKPEFIDQYLERHAVIPGNNPVDQIVDDVLKKFN